MFAARILPIKEHSRPLLIIAMSLLLAGCTTTNFLSGQNISAISSARDNSDNIDNIGNNNEIATTFGTISGGIIGKSIGAGIDDTDRRKALAAEYEALEYTPVGSEIVWRNEVSGNRGTVTPAATYDVGKKNCRQYVHAIYVDEKLRTAKGTACKEQDGLWQLVG